MIKIILYIVGLIEMILTNKVIAIDSSNNVEITDDGILGLGILIISLIVMIFAVVKVKKRLKSKSKVKIIYWTIIGVAYYILSCNFEITVTILVIDIIIYYAIYGISNVIINSDLDLEKYDDYIMRNNIGRRNGSIFVGGGGLILISRLFKNVLSFFWQNKNLKIENIENKERFENKYKLCKIINILVTCLLSLEAYVKGFGAKYIEIFYRNSIYIMVIIVGLISFLKKSKKMKKIGYISGIALGSIYIVQAIFNLINVEENKIYMVILLVIGIITIKNNIEFQKYVAENIEPVNEENERM